MKPDRTKNHHAKTRFNQLHGSRLGMGLILGGLFLLALAACVVGYNLCENQKAEQASADILRQLPSLRDTPEGEGELPLYRTNSDLEMPTAEVAGNNYIGRLDIPAIDLSLPVMSDWDYDNLKLAPCRYTGSAYRDDLVIAGHNYRSHFGTLKNLSPGAQIFFTDLDGNRFQYEVAALEQLEATDSNAMTDSGYPLTLFTCTLGGTCRLAIRCIKPA